MANPDSIAKIALKNIEMIEKMKETGKIEKELADVLLKNTSANQPVYNSIGLVVEDVRKISQKVDSVESKVVSLESAISNLKQSVDGVLQQNKENQVKIQELDAVRIEDLQKETIRIAKKEMFSEVFGNVSTVLQSLLLITTTAAVLGGIWKYLVQSAL